jgi:hypothetical protein
MAHYIIKNNRPFTIDDGKAQIFGQYVGHLYGIAVLQQVCVYHLGIGSEFGSYFLGFVAFFPVELEENGDKHKSQRNQAEVKV